MRAMLLAEEDMDDFGSMLRGGDESFKMGHIRGGSGSYRDLSYPSPTAPWDSGIGVHQWKPYIIRHGPHLPERRSI